MTDSTTQDLASLTVDLLSAYVANNMVRADDLAGLIRSTHKALASIGEAAAVAAIAPAPDYVPAVTARKSLASPAHIISMIDGKPYKTLKRHLSGHGLTPAEYRQRYNLPVTYPMVAPDYSEARRVVAHALGLGRKPRQAVAPSAGSEPAALFAAAAEATPPAAAKAPAKRGRKPKAAAEPAEA